MPAPLTLMRSALNPRFRITNSRAVFSSFFRYYSLLEADHIFFILDSSRAGKHFHVLYDSIFQRCRLQVTEVGQRVKPLEPSKSIE